MTISELYKKSADRGVLKAGMTEQQFRDNISTEEGLRSYYDYATTKGGMKFHDYDVFKERIGWDKEFNAQSTTQPTAQAAAISQAPATPKEEKKGSTFVQPVMSPYAAMGRAGEARVQQIQADRAERERMNNAQLPVTDNDRQREKDLQQLNERINRDAMARNEYAQQWLPEDVKKQVQAGREENIEELKQVRDELQNQRKPYMSEPKTLNEAFTNWQTAWSENTEEGQLAKAERDAAIENMTQQYLRAFSNSQTHADIYNDVQKRFEKGELTEKEANVELNTRLNKAFEEQYGELMKEGKDQLDNAFAMQAYKADNGWLARQEERIREQTTAKELDDKYKALNSAIGKAIEKNRAMGVINSRNMVIGGATELDMLPPELQAALQLYQDAETRLYDTKKGEGNFWTFGKEITRHSKNKFRDLATFGVSSIVDAAVQAKVLKKIADAGAYDIPEKVLDENEMILYDAIVTNIAVEAVRKFNTAYGAAAGEMTAEMLPFIRDIMIGKGLLSGATSAMEKALLRTIAKKIGNGAWGKLLANAGKTGINLAESTAIATLSPMTIQKTLQEEAKIDPTTLQLTDKGWTVGKINTMGGGRAYLKTVWDQIPEYFTETGGLTQFFKGMLSATKLGKYVSNSTFGQILNAFDKTNSGQLLKKTAYNGIWEQFGEELENTFYTAVKAAARADEGEGTEAFKNTYEEFFSKDSMLPMLLSFSLPAIVGGVVGTGEAIKINREYDKAHNLLMNRFQMMGYESKEDREDLLNTVIDKVYNAKLVRGSDGRALKDYPAAIREATAEIIDKKYGGGIDSDAAKDSFVMLYASLENYIYADQKLSALQAAHAKKQRQVQGLMRDVRETEQRIADNTHTNGMMYHVTTKGSNGVKGYIVSGNVSLKEYDNGMPTITNRDVVTVKMEDGSVWQGVAADLDMVDVPQSAETISMIERRRLTAKMNNLDRFKVGDVIYMTENGQPVDGHSSRVADVTDTGIVTDIIGPDGKPNQTEIPHNVAADRLSTISDLLLQDEGKPYKVLMNSDGTGDPIVLQERKPGVWTDVVMESQGQDVTYSQDKVDDMVATGFFTMYEGDSFFDGDVLDEIGESAQPSAPTTDDVASGNGVVSEDTGNNLSRTAQTIVAARNGDKEAQEKLSQYGIKWGHAGVYRYVGESEVEYLRNDANAKVMGKFDNGRVDVTGNGVSPTSATNADYQIEFKPSQDLYMGEELEGNRTRMKNEETEDGWLEGGYTLSDVAKIKKRNADGTYTVIYDAEQGGWVDKTAPSKYPTTQEGKLDWGQMDAPTATEAAIEKFGDKNTAKEYAELQIAQAKKAVAAANKKKATSTDADEFVAQKNAIRQEQQAAQAELSKWENILLGIANYKTTEEQAAAEEQAAQAAAVRAQRKQTIEGVGSTNMAERLAASPRIDGNAGSITAADGTKIPGHYVLVSANALTPSHNPNANFAPSEGYPTVDGQSINDRDYQADQEEQAKVQQVAQTYDGRAITNMPIVSDEGLVYSGNGRTMAGQLAAANGTDGAYTEALLENATQFGFTAEQVESVPNARVVFMTDERLPYNTTTLALFNQNEQQTQSNTASAAANVRKLTPEAVGHIIAAVQEFDTVDAFFGDSRAPFELVNRLIADGIISERDKAAFVDNGRLTNTGKDRLTALLFGTAFDEKTIRLLGDNAKVRNSVMRALPQILENKGLGDFSLFEHINNAIAAIYDMDTNGMSFFEFTRQIDIEGKTASDNYTAFELLLVDEMVNGGVQAFRDVLSGYNARAKESAGGQLDMFTGEVLTKEELTKQILQEYEQRKANERGGAQPESAVAGTSESDGEKIEPTLLNVVRTLYSKGKEVASKLFQRSYFDLAQTPTFMQDLGLRGDKFTIRYGVISRHVGKDAAHNLSESDWAALPEALQNPFAITKISNKEDAFRIYTTLQTESGEYVVVGADVKNAGREIEVNAISTVFGRRNDANLPENEEVIYRSETITPEQSSLLERPNFAQYPTEQEFSADKGTKNVPNTQEKTQKSVEEQQKSGKNRDTTERTPREEPKNTIFTDDAYAAARQRIQSKLNRLNAGIDPEMLSDGIIVAGYHVERGIRKFADFAKEMIKDFGDVIRPYLKSFYNGLRDLPESQAFVNEMDDYATVAGVDVNSITIEEQVQPSANEVQPSANEVQLSTEQVQPKQVSVEGLFNDLKTKGETKLSDNVIGEEPAWLQQYRTLKKKYPDAMLLFREGDFYEAYMEDADKASKILGVSLTKRGEYPMAGFPFYTLDTYLPKIIRAGHRVAFIEIDEIPDRANMIDRNKENQPNLAQDLQESEKNSNFAENIENNEQDNENLQEGVGQSNAEPSEVRGGAEESARGTARKTTDDGRGDGRVRSLASTLSTLGDKTAQEEYLKQSDLWLSPNEIEISRDLSKGKESQVYVSKDKKAAIKLVDYSIYSETPFDFVRDRIELFNQLFPKTAYTIVGVTERNGKLNFVLSQPLIRGKVLEDSWWGQGLEVYESFKPRLDEMMRERFGMENYGLDAYQNKLIRVQDLHYKNIIVDENGEWQVIDAVTTYREAPETKGTKKSEPTIITDAVGEITKSTDTRDGSDIWLVNPTDRVSKEEFAELKKRAKAHNGYYSNFKQNRGFLFRTEEDAIAFNRINENELTTDQVLADTGLVIGEAETRRNEAETIAENTRVEPSAPTVGEAREQVAQAEQEINKAIDKVDQATEQVNDQLMLLGYYKSEDDANEWGLSKKAEKAALKDVNKVANQLAKDLGVEGKIKASANIPPAGGSISFRIPLLEGKELYVSIPIHVNGYVEYYNAMGNYADLYIPQTKSAFDSVINHILYRVETPTAAGADKYGTNHFAFTTTKYKDFLDNVRSIAKEYLPEQVAQAQEQEQAPSQPTVEEQPQELQTPLEKAKARREKQKKAEAAQPAMGDLFAGTLFAVNEIEESINSTLPIEEQEAEEKAEEVQVVDETINRKFALTVKNDMLAALDSNTKPYRSIIDLRKRAKEIGMEVDNEGRSDILLQELVEDGLVRAAREVVEREGGYSKNAYDLVCKLYEMQPTIAARSSNRIKMQQYSTPLPMSWVADFFAMNGKDSSARVLEPTAGNGMLVFAIPARQVHVNELDETRLANLEEQGFGLVTNQDATQPFSGDTQYDAVIANPPFGQREAVEYDGKMIVGLDPQITLNALSKMKDNGRAAIIIGGNMEYAKNGAIKSMKPFFTYLYDHYNVKGVIDMSGAMYAKQGTTYPTRMILIDGRRTEEERAQTAVYPPVQSAALRKADNFDDLYEIIQEVVNSNNKTNGTEILRSQQGQLVSVNNESRGDTNGARHSEQPRKNDAVRSGGGRQSQNNTRESGVVLPREHRENTGNGEAIRETQTDNSGGSRGVPQSNIQRVGTERVSTDGVGLKQPKEQQKRNLNESKLPYRPHNTAFSLESVAPSAMVEAMDNVLSQIEQKHGSIDEFVRAELGYATIQEAHQALAAEQMDSVAMAIYQMKNGQALIIGDQTGVGKGRQMAALIRWAVKRGEKPIFVTQKADLFSDIYRDLVDIGSGDLVPFIFNSDGAMVDNNGNVVHKPLSQAEQKKVFESGILPDKYDFAVLTYSQVNTGDAISQAELDEANKKKGERSKKSKSIKNAKPTPKATFLRAIAENNYLFLDESHTAAGSSNTGAYLQSILRNAKAATFASATFAKRPDTMPLYAIRTAMSQANIDPDKMIEIIEKGGVTLQEIMSRELTNAGQMVRRERDMSGVITDWKTINDPVTVKRSRENYDRTIEAFNAIIKFQEDYVKPMIEALDAEIAVMAESAGVKKGTNKMGVENVPFASKTYNYTKQLMLALKVDAIADEVEAEINAGRHPVIALESTMESSIKDYAVGDVIKEPTFSASLLKGLDSVMQYTVKDENGNETHKRYLPKQLGEAGEKAYYELQDFIRKSTKGIFISPLDAIIERLHEKGYKVGELTGRNLYVERNENGEVVVRRRTDKDKKKMQREFNNGTLDVLILNKSASTGISLHASEKFSDQRQRSMIIAQPLSDINDYMQMIGRIDRTGQVHRGYYINLGLPVPAENRFLMMLSTKLKSLNANTTTSQDSESNDVEAPDLLNKYGSQVVIEYLRDNPEIYEKMGEPLKGAKENVKAEELDEYVAQEDDARKITGYVALLNTTEQERFYDEVVRRYNDLIRYLNETGSNDLKITVMPLRAKTIEKRVSSAGVNPNGENPFARDSFVEKVEMDVLRKPMKADEVRKTIEQINKGKAPAEYLESVIATIREEDKAKLQAEDERYERAKARAVVDIAKQTEKINSQTKRTPEEKRVAIENYDRETNGKVEGKHNDNVARINRSSDELLYRLRMFEVGKTYLVPDNLESFTFDFASPAIFCGYKTKDSKITASTTFAVFATLDGRRKVEIKLSQVVPLNNIEKMTNDNWYSLRSTSLDNWDTQIPNETRKVGFIMTGNILQAIADTQDEHGGYPGRLISYTDIDGNIHDGILMPDKWNTGMLQSSGAPLASRMQQIKDFERIVSKDGKVIIDGSRWAQTYFLTVSKTKKDGAMYFENKEILRLIEHNNFYPYRNNLRADVSAANIEKLVRELSKLGVKVKEDAPEMLIVENSINDKIRSVATDIWNKYQYDGELESTQDIAEYAEGNMPKNEQTQALFDAIDKWRDEAEEDRLYYGGRGDLEPFEDAVLDEVEKLMKLTDTPLTDAQQLIFDGLAEVAADAGIDIVEVSEEEAIKAVENTIDAESAIVDREGNAIGDGSVHAEYDIREDLLKKYPQISHHVSKSSNSESVYVTYENTDPKYPTWDRPKVTLRFSWHNNNAVRFGDQLNGYAASDAEILYRLGLAKRVFVPTKQKHISRRYVSKKDIASGKYEVADKTFEELFALPVGTDISAYQNKVAKDSNILILGDKVGEYTDPNYGRYEYAELLTNPITGKILGYAQGGTIYLTKAGMTPETMVHEYTHVWAKAMQRNNRAGWENIKEIFKQSPLWEYVKNDPNYKDRLTTDDAICSEVLARFSGKQGAERLNEVASEFINEEREKGGMLGAARVRQFINHARQAIKSFWKFVSKDLFGITKFDSMEDVADRVLYDMLNATELDVDRSDNTIELSIEMPSAEFRAAMKAWNDANPYPIYMEGESLGAFSDRLTAWKEARDAYRAELWRKSQEEIESADPISEPMVAGSKPVRKKDETPLEYAQRLKQWQNAQIDSQLSEEYTAEMNRLAGTLEKAKRAFVDAALPIEAWQKWLIERGATMTSESNAYQDMFLAQGRVSNAAEELRRDIIQKLTRKIAAIIESKKLDDVDLRWHNMDVPGTKRTINGNKLSVRELIGVYCQAKDCEEAEEKGLPDRGKAGFKNNLDVEYTDIVNAVETRLSKEDITELWHLINQATKYALDYDLASGRISQDTYDEFADREYYVPQRGWRERDESGLIEEYEPVGKRGHDPYNAALVKARGRQSLAADPFAYIMSIDHSSIVSSENNKIKQKMLQFCLDNEEIGLKTGAFRVKKYWLMHEIDPDTGKIRKDEDGMPITLMSYTEPKAEDFKHDKKVKDEVRRIEKEIAKRKKALEKELAEHGDTNYAKALQRAIANSEAKIEDLNDTLIIAFGATNTHISQRTRDEKLQHEVQVMKDGQRYVIELQDEKVANAINKKFKQHQEALFNVSDKMRNATRFMSAMLTQYNPEFAASNFVRDFQVAVMTLTNENPKLLPAFLKNFAACQRAVMAYAFADKVQDRTKYVDSDMGRLLEEYMKSGAPTGFSYMQDLKTLRKDFDSMVNEGKLSRGVRSAAGIFSMFTEISETAVRFAAYAAARKAGWAINDAAYMSKELTTNFDRAGEMADSGWMSWFSFMRATINGNVKFFRAFKKLPVAYSITAAVYFAMGLINQFANPNDPEDEVWASDYTRETNFIIGKWRIPVAHFIRIFYSAGVNMASWMQGERTFGHAVYNSSMSAFNEILPNYMNIPGAFSEWSDEMERVTAKDPKAVIRELAPTPISPFVDVWANRNFMGGTINREPFIKTQENTKDILMAKDNTLPIYRAITEGIYTAVGGDLNSKYKSDDNAWTALFDVSGSSLEHITEGYFTGGMDMLATTANMIYDAVQGNELTPDKITFIRKFYNQYTPQRAYDQQYWLLKGRVQEYKRKLNDYEDNNPDKYELEMRSKQYKAYEETNELIWEKIESPTTEDVKRLMEANQQWIKARK